MSAGEHWLVQRYNASLDCNAWGQPPPWDGDQVATLALCLEMARE